MGERVAADGGSEGADGGVGKVAVALATGHQPETGKVVEHHRIGVGGGVVVGETGADNQIAGMPRGEIEASRSVVPVLGQELSR